MITGDIPVIIYRGLVLRAGLKTRDSLVAADVRRLKSLGFCAPIRSNVRASLRRLLLFKQALRTKSDKTLRHTIPYPSLSCGSMTKPVEMTNCPVSRRCGNGHWMDPPPRIFCQKDVILGADYRGMVRITANHGVWWQHFPGPRSAVQR